MKKLDLAQTLFEIAYHSENPGLEVSKFLKETFPTSESRHYSAMLHFCGIMHEGDNHPMIYGMLWEAWKQFKAEQESK